MLFRRSWSLLSSTLRPYSTQSIDVETKKAWNGSRFGLLAHTQLGDVSNISEDTLKWPSDFTETYETCKGRTLQYRMLNASSPDEVARAAEIYRSAIDEMHGNSFYEWHHHPEMIQERCLSGDYALWATLDLGQVGQRPPPDPPIIAVNSTAMIRGQRAVDWIWGAVEPQHRGKGVWQHLGVFMDRVFERSGVQFAMVWMATTHDLSQRMGEAAGFRPMGIFPSSEFLAGSDGKYYRQSVVWYGKLYGDAKKYTQDPADMHLTLQSKKLADVIFADKW